MIKAFSCKGVWKKERSHVMKKSENLPLRLLIGVIAGAVLGLLVPQGSTLPFAGLVVNIAGTAKYILGQLINFCVPLIIIGFIAPSITRLGSNATRLLGVAIVIAYVSSVLAALMSMAAGYAIIPHLNIAAAAEEGAGLPVPFELAIPQIMPVMSALVFSILIGLAAVWTGARTIAAVLNEFQSIVLDIVKRVIIPILPFFIAVTFFQLGWNGSITQQLPIFLIAIVIVMAGHYIWLAILYGAAGTYSGRSGIEVVKHYGPAYLTAVGTMSSAATLAVALQCAHKSKGLRSDMVDFGVPLFANIHLCGSVLTEVFFCMTVSQVLYDGLPKPGTMVLFCVLLAVFAIGAPGVPGGTVMASMGLIVGAGSILGFDETGRGLMLAIFALQDSFGTACNVTGDGALTLILTGYAEKHRIKAA